MKRMIIFLLLTLGLGAAYLHSVGLLDDLPHIGRNLLKSSPEQPVDHFFYGLQSGELRFSGFAVDPAGRELLNELSPNSTTPDTENPYLSAATCQFSYEVVGHVISPENSAKGTVQLELNMVPVKELMAATVITGIGNIFSSGEDRKSAIISSLQDKGCTGETKNTSHSVDVINTPEGWKVSTRSLEKSGIFLLIRTLSELK